MNAMTKSFFTSFPSATKRHDFYDSSSISIQESLLKFSIYQKTRRKHLITHQLKTLHNKTAQRFWCEASQLQKLLLLLVIVARTRHKLNFHHKFIFRKAFLPSTFTSLFLFAVYCKQKISCNYLVPGGKTRIATALQMLDNKLLIKFCYDVFDLSLEINCFPIQLKSLFIVIVIALQRIHLIKIYRFWGAREGSQ